MANTCKKFHKSLNSVNPCFEQGRIKHFQLGETMHQAVLLITNDPADIIVQKWFI